MPISEACRPAARAGVSLLILTVSVLLLAIGLSVAIPRADLEVRRGKEDQLRFILGEFRRAIVKFERCHSRSPETIEELLRDSGGNRFLRKSYVDPFTGQSDWVFAKDTNGQLIVHSASEELSISGAKYSDFR